MNSILNYYPITATPLKNDYSYREVMPCELLRPFIRCFWGSEPYQHKAIIETDNIVIPDTCVDIIYNIDYTDNIITGGFCGINDESFYSSASFESNHSVATFAIRFYAWSAYKFSEDSLNNTKNDFVDIRSRFAWLDNELRGNLFDLKSLKEKIDFTQNLLLNRLEYIRRKDEIDCAVNIILSNKGNTDISKLAKESFISTRQLERVFQNYIGITPKKLSSLVRYQFLWTDIFKCPDFDVLNAVEKYGYTDQSHLLKEFKRYHSMDIKTAVKLALRQ